MEFGFKQVLASFRFESDIGAYCSMLKSGDNYFFNPGSKLAP